MTNSILSIGKRVLTAKTHKIHDLPVIILMPHSSCNCRCVMCDIWKANKNKRQLNVEDFEPHIENLRGLNVRQIVFSGGEALMHSNLWAFCSLLKKELNVKITLLSTGILMSRYASDIIEWCDEVIVSLDGSERVHNEIRNIPNAYKKMEEGIKTVRQLSPNFRITGRCVLQQLNYLDFPNIISTAKSLKFQQISFLGADVSTVAFNRPTPMPDERIADIALSPNEVNKFKEIIEDTIRSFQGEFDKGFIAESPQKIRSIAQYYAALNGQESFPLVRCNAPWVSTVIESNGDVQPCFFFPKIGNIFEEDLTAIINSERAIAFRKKLKASKNPICQKCVCSLYLKPTVKL